MYSYSSQNPEKSIMVSKTLFNIHNNNNKCLSTKSAYAFGRIMWHWRLE